MSSITFENGRTYSTGDRVRVSTKNGTQGIGTVRAILRTNRVRVKLDTVEQRGALDRWPLKAGGVYDRLMSEGICGGEIVGRV